VTAFTRLGSSLWDWEPWVALPCAPRILWLALFTSGEAKRHAPGLWQGGIPSMADAAKLPGDEVVTALDALIERGMVEYDSKYRVLRLCELPDAGEYPSNGKMIRGWWTRFRSVPECGVRDAHVVTLRWILDTGARLSGKEVSADHENAWRDTFARVAIPPPRRRGVRRLADSDTSTHTQPSLFGSPSIPALLAGNGIAPSGEQDYPQESLASVDNSAALHQPNKIRAPETVSDTVSDTNRIPDPRSQIPEIWISSGERDRGRGDRAPLTLVPPYTLADVLRELAQGLWDPQYDRTHQNALSALLAVWVAGRVTLDDFVVLAKYSVHSGVRMNARWLAGCDLAAEVSTARRVIEWRDVRMASMADL